MWFPRLRVDDRKGTPRIGRAEGADSTLVINKINQKKEPNFFMIGTSKQLTEALGFSIVFILLTYYFVVVWYVVAASL